MHSQAGAGSRPPICDGRASTNSKLGKSCGSACGSTRNVARCFAAEAASTSCDHAGGLGYLLRALPSVAEGPVAEVRLVGARGALDRSVVERVAAAAVDEVAP